MSNWVVNLIASAPLPPEVDRVTHVAIELDEDAALIAGRAMECLVERGYQGEGIILALPSSWCMACHFSSPPRRRDAWLYQMEEFLPVAVESALADSVITSETMRFGVAVDRRRVEALIRGITKRGGWVIQVAAWPLLLAEATREPHANFLIHESSHTDFIAVRAGRPSAWCRLGTQSRHAGRLQAALPDQAAVGWQKIGECPRWLSDVIASCGLVQQTDMDAGVRRLLQHIDRSHDDRIGWLDMGGSAVARDRLRLLRWPLGAAYAGMLLLSFIVAAVLLARTNAHQQRLANERSEQERLYQVAFPAKSMPLAIHSRLSSELRKSRSLANPSTATPSSLQLLAWLLEAVPVEPIRIDRVDLDGARIRLEGTAASLDEVDRLSASLRARNRLRVHSAKTEPKEEAIAFTAELTTVTDGSAVRRQ